MSRKLSAQSIRYLRWIADRNPFYLLSATSGLLGCWLLGDVSSADVANVGIRIATLLTYQVIVVFLAIWLSRSDRTRRDAAILSVLTFVLAADFSFFYTQTAMLALTPAIFFALSGMAQSLVITGFLFSRLETPLSKPAQWLLGVDFVAVFTTPLAIRLLTGDTTPSPLVFLGAFTMAGALLAAHALPSRWRTGETTPDVSSSAAASLSRGVAIVAPVVGLASLVAHVFASRWAYDVPFFAVFLSPLFMGAAALCLRLEARRVEALRMLTPDAYVTAGLTPGGCAGALAFLAVWLALGNPIQIAVWDGPDNSWFGFSPLRLAILGAGAVFWGLWRNGGIVMRSTGAPIHGE